MKTAFLIIAHHQPAHLAKLVQALNRDWDHIFIHVDLKVDKTPFVTLVPKDKNIRFLDDSQRTKVFHAGFTLVQATLNLLNAGLKSGENFERFCLLSGADYPIKTMDQIKGVFDSNKEFIGISRRLGDSDHHLHSKFVRRFYFPDLPMLEWFISGWFPKKVYDKITLYHGSQWWALTSGCIKYIWEFLQTNPDYLRFHQTANCPDEIFFHSIVKSSPFVANISHDFENPSCPENFELLNEHGCHYVDWYAKHVTLPKVLTIGDYPALTQSRCLFARKFDEKKSSELIATLEKTVMLR